MSITCLRKHLTLSLCLSLSLPLSLSLSLSLPHLLVFVKSNFCIQLLNTLCTSHASCFLNSSNNSVHPKGFSLSLPVYLYLCLPLVKICAKPAGLINLSNCHACLPICLYLQTNIGSIRIFFCVQLCRLSFKNLLGMIYL